MPEPPILYTQVGCAESAKIRAWLTEHDVSFIERDASADAEAAIALAATGAFATPLFVLGREKVLGFRPQALTAALNRASMETSVPGISELVPTTKAGCPPVSPCPDDVR